MSQPKKVTIACPDCSTKLSLTVRPGDEGKKVTVRCASCGQSLRTRLPEKPKVSETPMNKLLDDLLRQQRYGGLYGRGGPFGL